jgi:O-antigen/teichoic acid export membrane protein
MGGWSFLCSLLIFGLLFHHTTGAEPYSLRDVYRLLRRYAGWSVLSSVCLWLRFQSILFLLAWFVGVAAVAQTRAILNIASPLDQALVALHASWLVRFSAAQREGGRLPIIGTTLAYCSAVGIAAALLWLVSAPLVSFLYDGRYTEYAWEVPWYYVALGFLGIEHILSSAFKVRGLLRTGYLPQIGSILLGAGAGLVLVQHFGQPGAIFAIAVLYASSASLVATLLSRSRIRRRRAERAAEPRRVSATLSAQPHQQEVSRSSYTSSEMAFEKRSVGEIMVTIPLTTTATARAPAG